MVFTSNSVILNGGTRMHLDVYISSALLDVDIPDFVWEKAITNFNKVLNKQLSNTKEINAVPVDVIQLESVQDSLDYLRMGAVVLLLIIKEEDIEKIADIHFRLTGFLTLKPKSDIVESMTSLMEVKIVENIGF